MATINWHEDPIRQRGDDVMARVFTLENRQVVTITLPPRAARPGSATPTSSGSLGPDASLPRENRAWIAGVVVAAFITIAIPVGILFCYWRRHKRRPKRNSCDAAPDKTQLQSDCLLKTMPEADTNGIYELYVRPTPLGAEMPANEVATREVSVRDETTAVELDMTRELGEMMASSDVSGGSRRPN